MSEKLTVKAPSIKTSAGSLSEMCIRDRMVAEGAIMAFTGGQNYSNLGAAFQDVYKRQDYYWGKD